MADDFSNTTGTAGSISVGGTAAGNIETVDDTDWFKTTLLAGHTYQFDLEGSATGQGSLVDPYMSVRDSSGNTKLAEADNGGTGLNARFIYTPTTTGTYFLAAGAGFSPNGTGTYRMRLTDVTATNYSITPGSVTVNEGAGTVTFTINRGGGLPAETVFASTTQNQGSANNGDYTGIANQALSFSSGQASASVTVELAPNLGPAGLRKFRFIRRQTGRVGLPQDEA